VPFYEGYGMPVREALLCGTPVVASDIPVLHEASGGHALFVPPEQAAIERLLRQLAVNPGMLQRPDGDALSPEPPQAAAERFAGLLERLSA
jgi:glycosyltransferase involved in cell wall biosynthesis